MTSDEIKAARMIAEAATQADWWTYDGRGIFSEGREGLGIAAICDECGGIPSCCGFRVSSGSDRLEEDLDHMAHFAPPMVLKMLDWIEGAREQIKGNVDALNSGIKEFEELYKEIEKLKEEIEFQKTRADKHLVELNQRALKRYTLFDAIKHGDEKHREWLNAAINAHYNGNPIPKENSGD